MLVQLLTEVGGTPDVGTVVSGSDVEVGDGDEGVGEGLHTASGQRVNVLLLCVAWSFIAVSWANILQSPRSVRRLITSISSISNTD